MLAESSARVFRRRNKPRYTQTVTIRRFCRKLSDMSLPFEIFRRLNALSTVLCLQKVVHAFSVVETSPDTETTIIRRFCRKLSDISLPFEIFRRLSVLFTALCVQNVVHASRPTSKQAEIHANCNNSSILKKIKRYFSPV